MKLYTENLKESLDALADIEFQRRSWFASAGPEISSFTELVCRAFDDTGLGDILDDPWLQEAIGEVAADKLRALHHAISRIDDRLGPDEVFALPEMTEIRLLARQALDAMPK